ncbi:MAG: L-lactate dehydrogenase [Lawsonibacter sp.]|uniref:L-lactate dehydrogenase n=1 Tax=Lawsonibacter sp. JLR.KK007 TaxID=3114293 RepID=UPI00216B7CE7|nr:L-lactate dehydrogenase [Lawsonibacter sp.]MCI8989757.1 L-lactate dehydrogenase [Lawsonibacter sp.]MCI9268818.1 L-lactate dehydrogenase [Lawsonibacter sp.]
MNYRKAAIVGCGFVGASIAFRFLQQGLFSNLVLLDANRDKAEGEAMDLSDGLPYGASMEITAGTYDDIADCGLVVITAGVNQKPGETRLQLIERNAVIMRSIVEEIKARPFGGILLIVSNPVDVLTHVARELSGYPKERVIGSGTVLDTARLKQLLGEELGVDSRNVHAFIVGEHGDSELAVWSGANVSGLNLDDFCRLRGKELHEASKERIYQTIRDSANEIIKRKAATYYGIAMAVGRIAECIVKDEQAVLPISVGLEGEYGLDHVTLSIPSIVGKNGLEKILEIPLGESERLALDRSAQQLQEVIAGLKL